MKLGICAGIDAAQAVHEAGFDFIECRIGSLMPEESDATFAEQLEKFNKSPISVEAFNVLVLGDFRITGDNIDYDRIHRYLKIALERVKLVGADTVVFGSGAARSLPEGFDRDKGVAQIEKFLNILADYADPLNITIVIEPLCLKGSNMINTVPEAVEYVQKVNRKSIQALADFYHMDEDHEPLENIVTYKDHIRHIHVADTGRKAPGTGVFPYARFAECVRRAGYDGRISVECEWDDLQEQASAAHQFLTEQFGL